MARRSAMSSIPEGLTGKQANRYKYLLRTKGKDAANAAATKFAAKNKYNSPGQVNNRNGANNFNMGSPEQALQSGMDANKETANLSAQFNRPDEQGMFGGSQEWTQNPDGSWTKTTKMSDTAQEQVDLGNQVTTQGRQAAANLMGTAAANYSQPYNYDNISPVMGGQQLGDARNKAQQSAFDNQIGRLQSGFDQKRKDFETLAATRGWVPGSKNYEREKSRMESDIANQINDIATSSYNTGLNEYNTMFNTSTSDRQRQIQEMNAMRDRPLQEASNMFGMGPGPQIDQFTDYGPINVEGVDASKYYATGMQKTLQDSDQSWQAKQKRLDREAQLKAASIGASAARGAGGENLTAAQQMELARQQMLWERQNGFRPNPNSGGGGGWGSAAQGFGQGIGTGLGYGIAHGIMG